MIFRPSIDKRVLSEEFPNRSSGSMQALRAQYPARPVQGSRGCAARCNFAFDFEEMNKQMFFGQYKRINSYFEGTELASSGLPEGKELEILETVARKVPPEVFTKPYTNPVGGNPEAVRDNLREALRLLKEAGYEVRDRKLVDARRQASYASRSWCRIRPPSGSRCSTSLRWNGIGVTAVDPHRRRRAVSRTGSQFRFRRDHRRRGAIAVARQRAARILGLAGGRHARLAQHHRHQESRDRRTDRAA